MVSESTATIAEYAYSKIIELRKLREPRIVAFIDIGNSKTTVTIAEFRLRLDRVEARVLLHNSDKDLGGRNLDYLLCEKIAQEF